MTFLAETCQNIRNTLHAHHADLLAYLRKELSLDENEAEKDIEMIFSWLQQFIV